MEKQMISSKYVCVCENRGLEDGRKQLISMSKMENYRNELNGIGGPALTACMMQ